MPNTYDIGDVVRLSVDFKVGSTLTDPTTVTLKIMDPAGTTSTFTYAGAQVVKDATGEYHYDYSPTTAGEYHWRWEGTGSAKAASEGTFIVRRSQFS